MDDQTIRFRARVSEVITQLVWEELVRGKPLDKAVESAKDRVGEWLAEFLDVPTEQLIAAKNTPQKVETD